METKPPLPPFTEETAIQKIRMAEDAWNTRDPEKVALVYTEDTIWRNRAEFPQGREEVKQFLKRKWSKELNYRLIYPAYLKHFIKSFSLICSSFVFISILIILFKYNIYLSLYPIHYII